MMIYSFLMILIVTFIANQRHVIVVDLDKIDLNNENNFDEDVIIQR